jgi:hypothetical protein
VQVEPGERGRGAETLRQAVGFDHVFMRNQNAFAAIVDNERHRAENEDIEERFRRILADRSIPLAQRVRMACTIGAVFSALMGAGAMFGDASTDEVAGYVREAVRDLVRGLSDGRAAR